MIRTLSGFMRASFALTVIVAGAVFICGCGDSSGSTDPSTQTAPSPAVPAPPAVAQPKPLKFEQLTLQSKAVLTAEPNGPAYYSFAYMDNDGKVYKCRMPQAMAKGEYTADQWIRTFTLYRLPAVIKQKKVVKDANNDGLNDFPFIAPKPNSSVAPPAGGAPGGAPMPPSAPLPANYPMKRG